MKSEIIRELGEGSMLLPSLIREGLAANDRIKVRMSALQAAAQHAAHPEAPITDLSAESRAACLALTLRFAGTCLIRVVRVHRQMRRFEQRSKFLQQGEEVAHD